MALLILKMTIPSVSFISNFKKKITRLRDGFSLLEMAIVLIVIGLLSGMALPLLTLQNQRINILKTREHQEYVMEALASYMARHGALPCPADPNAKVDQFGIGLENCFSQNLPQGIIPFRTLGIAEKWIKDGFGHYMTYAPEKKILTDNGRDFVCFEPHGDLHLKDSFGNEVIPLDDNQNFIAVILVSHGPIGSGAFQGQGSAGRLNIKSLKGAKLENANGDSTFSEYVASASEEFDDIIRWESRNQFLSYYAKFSCVTESQESTAAPQSTPTSPTQDSGEVTAEGL